MAETKRNRWRRAAVLAFMAVVTACLLALAMEQAARGGAGIPGVLVYGLAAGFGLEFVGSTWSGHRHPRREGRRLHSES